MLTAAAASSTGTAGAAQTLTCGCNIRAVFDGRNHLASLALFRFTKGPWGAGLVLGLSLLFWLVAPTALAVRRLRKADV